MSRIKRIFSHMLVRHHCSVCNARVIPFDSFESRTESPEEGAKGNAVLLYSFNQKNKDNRRAWCWSCKGWVTAKRLLEDDIRAMYIRRRGVTIRNPRKEA